MTNKEFDTLQNLIGIRDTSIRVLNDLEYLEQTTKELMENYNADLKEAIQWICNIHIDANKLLKNLLSNNEFYNKLP